MGKGVPWESWAWDVLAREVEGNGTPGVQTREQGRVGKWQGRGNAGRNMPGTPTIIGGANAGGALNEHVHQAWRAYLNTPDH